MSFDEYLTHIKKTKDEMLTEFAPEAERRARFQMLINAIAKDAALSASDEEVEEESKALMQMYPGADEIRTKAYADMMITNNKVLSMLENI
jgi:FKBP-type peptidyl-prolyl cis-trans isomerase (trigger factor)